MTERPDDPEASTTNDPTGHLSNETIADLQEGLLADEAAQRARAHLQECPVCAAQDGALAGVPLLLAAAGDTGPPPADVIERVDAALAAEPPVRPGAATVTALADHARVPRPPLSMRVLQAAAVFVVLLAGLGIAVSTLGGGADDDSATSADSSGGASAQGAPEAGSAYPVTASGRNWDEESLVAAVPELVSGQLGPPVATDSGSDGGADGGAGAESEKRARELASAPAGRLADGPALAECVGRLNLGPVTPLSVDLAQWQGNPAGVIVLPTADDPGTVDVFVIEPDCPEGTFLFFTRAPRP